MLLYQTGAGESGKWYRKSDTPQEEIKGKKKGKEIPSKGEKDKSKSGKQPST